MDRLESMSAFVAVAKARGFSAAARELGVPLATLNRRVVDLERDMGVRLLHRSTRQVVLTVHLIEENIDLAPRFSELPDSSLIARPLGHVQMVVSASPAYLQRHGIPQEPSDVRAPASTAVEGARLH